MLEFGASFRKARESRNVSIDRIAVETRISTRFLLAIENEQFELLPGGIFNRGFIRTYAERLGLDPEEAIRGYESLSRPSESEPLRQEAPRVRGKTTRIPLYYVAMAGLLILVVIFTFANRRSEPTVAAVQPPATSEPAVATPVAAAATIPENPAAAAATEPAPVTAPIAAPVPPPVTTAPASPVIATVAIDLEVREDSWFRLSADGAPVVVSEVLPAGTTRRYTANTTMEFSIGNAAGVTLRVNGQQVSSLGKTGQVRNLTVTPTTTAASLAGAPN